MQSQGLPGGGHWHSANDIASEGLHHKSDKSTTYNIYEYELKYYINLNLLSGVWRQWDGTLLSWTPWWSQITRHELGGAEASNCAGISLGGGEWAGKWWTAVCSTPNIWRYICERDI